MLRHVDFDVLGNLCGIMIFLFKNIIERDSNGAKDII